MATLNVPGTYATVQAAVNAASPGDVIIVGSGYPGVDTVFVTVDNLIFDVPASVPGIAFQTAGGTHTITLTGASDSYLSGGAGNDTLTGNSGDDHIYGNGGNDRISGGDGDDFIQIHGGAGEIDGGAGWDTVWTSDLGTNDYFSIETIDALGGVLRTTPQQLNRFYLMKDSSGLDDSRIDLELWGGGFTSDHISFGTHSVRLIDDGLTSSIAFTGSNNGDILIGSTFANDYLMGMGGNDVIIGGGGDWLEGGDGSDSIIGNGSDTATYSKASAGVMVQLGLDGQQQNTVGAGIDTLTAISGLRGSAFDDLLIGDGGDNTLEGEDGNDQLWGGAGNDRLKGGAGNDTLDGGAGVDTADYLGNQTTVEGFTVDLSLSGAQHVRSDQFDTLISIENLLGSAFDDRLAGNAEANSIIAYGGDDVVTGGAGADFLDGGWEIFGDTLSYLTSAGGVHINLATGAASGGDAEGDILLDFENVQGSAFAADVLIGNAKDNALVGWAGDDWLEGGDGDDFLDGIGGTDTASYASASAGVTVNLATVDPQDTVGAGIDTLIDIETLVGSSFGDVLTGNIYVNRLIGGDGNDKLDGGEGTDSLEGGAGNDSYFVDSIGDGVLEAAGQGTDTVTTTLSSYTLGANLEGLVFAGSSDATGIGNELDNSITGGTGNDVLDGGMGNDRMVGGAGNDTVSYATTASGVTVSLATTEMQATGGSGNDSLRSIENLVGSAWSDTLTGHDGANILKGGAGNDALDGGAGNDTLDGGIGADHLTGGLGNDVFVVDDAGDSVVEAADGGTDTVMTGLSVHTLAANVENLVFTGVGYFIATGNALDNTISGGADNDLLEGGAGNDTLEGGAGIDLLFGGSGIDTASYASATSGVTVSLTLPIAQDTGGAGYDVLNSIENVIGSSYGDLLVGRSGANRLVGREGNDTLDGGAGADRMEGGAGDDVFLVDDRSDKAVEGAGEGYDTVLATASSFTLGANVEALFYVGDGNFTGTGNGLDNQLYGAAGNDTLEGGAGNDALYGGAGIDTASYASAQSGVTVHTNDGGAGQHTVGAGVDTLFSIENLTGSAFDDTLAGDAGGNLLKGGDGDDLLNGGAGADRMEGGLGNDFFVVDAPNDIVVERAGGGIDTVSTVISVYTLGTYFENLLYVGGLGNFTGTGNALANLLRGGSGDDILSGGGGADALDGMQGIDTASYAGASAGVAASLADATENTGDAAGDTYDSIENLDGSRYNDVLTGDSGNNRLNGGRGNDTLTGGLGYDRFVFDQPLVAGNVDTIVDFTHGDDGFALSTSVFAAAGPAGLLFGSAFHIGAAAHDADDRIIYNATSGALLYDADGTGGKAAVTFANIGAGQTVTEYDFQLV